MSHALLTARGEEEPGINMTPMIDIVFQLIVFFLLTLKFKTVDRRIDSALPRDVGRERTLDFVDESPRVVVKLFRERHESPGDAFTRIRVGNRWSADLPRTGNRAARARVLERLGAELRTVHALLGSEAEGEIKTPAPKGFLVPHGDVMAVLDAFLSVDVRKVRFQGARSPLPR